MNKWTKRFLDQAKLVATWSKDPSTGVGAVITRGKFVVSQGFNGFASKVRDTQDRLDDRNIKYPLTIHAELNAILAAKQDLKGCTLYITHPPCANCASIIIQSGISAVICILPDDDFLLRWTDHLKLTTEIFKETETVFLMIQVDK